MTNADFPINSAPYTNRDGNVQHDVYLGLTKREYFAAMAMNGLLAADVKYNDKIDDRESLVKDAIAFADELLNQLSK